MRYPGPSRNKVLRHLVWHYEIQIRSHLLLRSRFDLSKLCQRRRLGISLASLPALLCLEERSVFVFAGRVDKLV
jgi:hypothetical protein